MVELAVEPNGAAATEAAGLLPRRARLDGPTPVGDKPAELLASAEQLLRQICVEVCTAAAAGPEGTGL
ncbi:MAG: hypothetical protein ACRDPL_12555 [Propionibacteriaceae bacterium]